jgi:hypothetical protein
VVCYYYADEHALLQAQFANSEVVAANERVVLTDAMDDRCAANYTPSCAQLADAIHGFR